MQSSKAINKFKSGGIWFYVFQDGTVRFETITCQIECLLPHLRRRAELIIINILKG